MSDGALRISILGDASQFKDTLADLQKRLENFKEDLKTATGLDIPRLNLEIFGAEKSIKQITEFGKFAEGSLGFYEQLKKQLSEELRVTTNRAEQEQLVKRLSDVSNIIKDIKSAGIEKPIPVPIVIEPPPPGSIADIKRQISETVKEKEIAIGVNLTNANVKLQGLRNELSVLEKQGIEIEAKPVTPVLENSIQGIKNQIDELNRKKVLIDIANEGEIAKINQDLDGLATKLARATSISFDKNGAISANAGKSRQALTSLALVAQDLPFGFIAIQNNLPAVISSFGALKASAVGTAGVMSSLGAALAGPAGLFLAFSVVTGAVTFAVQKYGSLTGAIEALFGRYTDLGDVVRRAKEDIDDFNKSLLTNNELISKSFASVQGNITKAEALSKVVLDLSKSDGERKLALQSLQKLDKERFKAFDVEKNKLTGLADAVNKYTESQIAASKADAFTNQLNSQAEIVEANRNALFSLQDQIDELTEKYPNITSELKNYEKAQIAATKTFGVRPFISIPEEDILKFQQLTNESKKFSNQLIESNNKLENLKATVSTFIVDASAADVLEETGNKAAQAAKKVKEYVKEFAKVVPLFNMFSAFEGERPEFNFDIVKNLFSESDLKRLKFSQKRLNTIQKELDKFREATPKLPNVTPRVILTPEAREAEIFRENLAKQFEDTKNVLQEVFFAPLSDLFQNFFDNGKIGFEEFGKSVLNTIKSLVSKILATGIIYLLANLIPGGGIAAKAVGGISTGAGEGIFGALSAAFKNVLGIGKIANPNFGGVQGGGMQLAGEVVFRQRGSDLIGVINRTNGTINRVG